MYIHILSNVDYNLIIVQVHNYAYWIIYPWSNKQWVLWVTQHIVSKKIQKLWIFLLSVHVSSNSWLVYIFMAQKYFKTGILSYLVKRYQESERLSWRRWQCLTVSTAIAGLISTRSNKYLHLLALVDNWSSSILIAGSQTRGKLFKATRGL